MSSFVFNEKQMQDPEICRGVAISELERNITPEMVMVALISPELAQEKKISLSCGYPGDPLYDFMADMEGGADVQIISLSKTGWIAFLVEPLPGSTSNPVELVCLSADIRGILFSEVHHLRK